MGKHTDIETALLQAYVDGAFGLPTAAENARFDKPTDGSPWAAVFVVSTPEGVQAVTCGDAGEDEHVGILQIDLNYPLLKGVRDARSKADQVTSFFRIGRQFASGVARVTVRSCSKAPGREVDGWYKVVMTVQWYARVPRAA